MEIHGSNSFIHPPFWPVERRENTRCLDGGQEERPRHAREILVVYSVVGAGVAQLAEQ
jgi:hypothetical protein